MSVVEKNIFKVIFAGKDITKDISSDLTNIEYTDNCTGESDEITLTIQDPDLKWQNEWYPDKGTKISVSIGYEGITLNCGDFKIDQIEISGAPDVMTIRALASYFQKNIRTKKSYAHEDKTLKEIVNSVAQSLGYTVNGTIKDIKIGRVTQNNESDLSFLKKLADRYGYYFSIRDTVITFILEQEIDGSDPVFEIDRRDIKQFNLTDKVHNTYKGAKLSYKDPATGEEVEQTSSWTSMISGLIPDNLPAVKALFSKVKSDVKDIGSTVKEKVSSSPYLDNLPEGVSQLVSGFTGTSDDDLILNTKAENGQQAEAISDAALYRANKSQFTGSITVIGNPLLVAGNTFMLSGMGKFSGKYIISQSKHIKDRSSGYICTLQISKVSVTLSSRIKSVKKPAKDATK